MPAKAGIVLVTKFIENSSKKFSQYVDYIDRDEAIRNEAFETFTVFEEYVGSYMDDKKKTYGLFTDEKDVLLGEGKENMKELFAQAQKNGSLMWQTVISFDNDFLRKNGLYDEATSDIDEEKLREYTRKTMHHLLEKEELSDAIWTASVHKNTDNIHIHIATVQPTPSWSPGQGRCQSRQNGKLYQRGVWKQRSIDSAKSVFANSVLAEQIDNQRINYLKRERILAAGKAAGLSADASLRRDFVKLAEALPEDLRLLKYGNQAMVPYRDEINQLTQKIIANYCAEDYLELTKLLEEADESYKDVYGESKQRSFSATQLEDLNYRMGNVILNQAKEYKQQMRLLEQKRILRSSQIRRERMQRAILSNSIQKSVSGIRRNLRNDCDNLRNEAAYQRMIQQAERG